MGSTVKKINHQLQILRQKSHLRFCDAYIVDDQFFSSVPVFDFDMCIIFTQDINTRSAIVKSYKIVIDLQRNSQSLTMFCTRMHVVRNPGEDTLVCDALNIYSRNAMFSRCVRVAKFE